MNYKIKGEFSFTAKQFEDSCKEKSINIEGSEVTANILSFDVDDMLSLEQTSDIYQIILQLNQGA